MAQAARLLTFRAGGTRLALSADRVREVVERGPTTAVPHAPPGLLGLANVRGVVLPVIAGAAFSDGGSTDAAVGGRLVVVEGRQPVAIAVDSIEALSDDAAGARAIDLDAFLAETFSDAAAPLPRPSSRIQTAAMEASAEVALLMFSIGDQSFALPLKDVAQVIHLPDAITRMPHADAAVVGTVPLGSALLPLLSLAQLLGLPGGVSDSRSRVVVVRIGSHIVGLVVDDVRAVIRVTEDRIDPLPAALLRGQAEARIQAICRYGNGSQLVSVLAVDQLVRDELTARMLQGSGEHEVAAAAREEGRERYLVFRLGTQKFALSANAVDEVLAMPREVARLPRAPAFVAGVIERRGRAVPLIDQVLRFSGQPAGQARRIVVVSHGALTAGFIVDAPVELLTPGADSIGAAPAIRGEATVFEQVIRDGDRTILVIGAHQLLDRAAGELLGELSSKASTRTS